MTEARASLTLTPPFNQADTVRGLTQFSHIWLIFVFHATQQQGWHKGEPYDFTQAHVDELMALDQAAPAYPHNLLVMLETGDETLNWRDAHHYYHEAHQLIFQGGDHGFTRFRDVLDLIDKF